MSDEQYRRLRWRCRRGMLELDVLLNSFLDRQYADLTTAERADFERFLTTPDAVLVAWCSGTEVPEDHDLMIIMNKILQDNDF